MKVLIVEDDKNILEYLKKGVAEAGYSADAVSDGEEAIFYALINSYDIILLDIILTIFLCKYHFLKHYKICSIIIW